MIEKYLVARHPKQRYAATMRTVFCVVDAKSGAEAKRRATPEVLRPDPDYTAPRATLLETNKTYYL